MGIGADTRREVRDSTWGHCWYCGRELVRPRPADPESQAVKDRWFVVDHVVPKTRGGTDDSHNLVPACAFCNGSKGKKRLEEYRLYVTMLLAGIPNFTQEQIDWLRSQGFEVVPVELLKFWGERPYSVVPTPIKAEWRLIQEESEP